MLKVLTAIERYPAAVFLDLGANLGMYSLAVAGRGGRVIAVDPVLENLALLRASLARSGGGSLVR